MMKLLFLMTAAFFACTVLTASELLVKDGDKIAFLGDSITKHGYGNKTNGFVHLVIEGLKKQGLKDISVIPAGVSGHKSTQMLARLEQDVIAKKPQWMLLSCGVNDVWHQFFKNSSDVSLEDYKKNITEIVDKTQAAGIKVMLLTSTMITENSHDPKNIALKPYNAFLLKLAKERNLPVADLNARMFRELCAMEQLPGNRLTIDGVHMNAMGNVMMASGILEAFGVSPDMVAKLRDEWFARPRMMPIGSTQVMVSVNEYMKLRRKVAKDKQSLDDIVTKVVRDFIDTIETN